MVGGRCQDKNPNQPQQPWGLNKSRPPPPTLSCPCNKHKKLETKSAHLPQGLPVLVTSKGNRNDGHEVQHWGVHCYTIALTCPDKSSIALIALIVRAMPQLCVLLIFIHKTSCWFFCLTQLTHGPTLQFKENEKHPWRILTVEIPHTLKEKELHGPGGGSCNDLPLNLYKRNFMDSAYNLKTKKHSRRTLTAE